MHRTNRLRKIILLKTRNMRNTMKPTIKEIENFEFKKPTDKHKSLKTTKKTKKKKLRCKIGFHKWKPINTFRDTTLDIGEATHETYRYREVEEGIIYKCSLCNKQKRDVTKTEKTTNRLEYN